MASVLDMVADMIIALTRQLSICFIGGWHTWLIKRCHTLVIIQMSLTN